MPALKRLLLLMVLFASCAFVLVFCLRNTVLVDIDLLFTRLDQVSIDVLMVGSFIAGGLLGVLFSLGLLYRLRKKYRQALLEAKQNPQAGAAASGRA